ncbi:hypothetical protein BOX15_Mlig033363g1 [Macrostomum lignano]|nr:hypothetical protein BOX15_Mlig030579g1 [Macrostomum lignano]PAA79622.1 hypothetical protein BOX15_Mlig033363g1 [Macrostomum lignano]
MFGPVHPSEIPPEVCYANCPRIYPRPEADNSGDDGAGIAVPEEYNNEAGRRIYSERDKPCYVVFRFNRSHCRALRNFIISNSSKLEVMTGMYCGISTKVFNINSNTLEPNASIGVLRFKTTHSAYRFVMSENRMNRQEFLGGRFDIWNLTLCAEDQSIIPNPANPDKMVNHMNVLHFMHVRKVALLPDDLAEQSLEAREKAEADAAAAQKELEESLHTVEGFNGRVVVKTSAMARLRGLPMADRTNEPQKLVYVTQWRGVYYFWQWFEGEHGRRFINLMKDFSGSNYESLLLTLCLDFHDLM